MGRYIEQAEHVARYTKVHYVSSLDAPFVQSKEFVLSSILNMAGVYADYLERHAQLTDDDVLYYVTLSDSNASSIIASINRIRENARGARDRISMELWEATNRFYHDMNRYTSDRFHKEGIYNFSQKVEENSAILKGYIDNTLMRNEVWLLISLGIHVERVIQVLRIILNKAYDIQKLESAKLGDPLEYYQWNTLLKSAESFDMCKRHYAANPDRKNALEFLLFNPVFPKSVTHNLAITQQIVQKIGFQEQKGKGSIDFLIGKLSNNFQFLTIEEVDDTITEFLQKTLTKIYAITNLLEVKYLVY